MKKVNKTQVFLLLGGLLLFAYSVYVLGGDSLKLITSNFDLKYMLIYLGVTFFSICPIVWRWQAILDGYEKRVGFWTLLRLQLSGYAVSYVTPSARIGGEPLRIYLLKKDCDVDYKVGTASIILDKYMEYLGAITFGMIGMILLFLTPGMPIVMKRVLVGLIVFSIVGLGIIYYRLSHEKGLFLNLFNLFISEKRLAKMSKNLKDIDSKLSSFIIHKKISFFKSYLFYVMSGFLFLVEFKYLLLSFGVTSTVFDLILIGIVVGVANLVPTPMSLGSLEAGQGGLFYFLKGDGSIGLAFSFVHRIRGMLISAIGFLLIMIYSGKDIIKKSEGL